MKIIVGGASVQICQDTVILFMKMVRGVKKPLITIIFPTRKARDFVKNINKKV